MSHDGAFAVAGTNEPTGAPEVGLQRRVSVVDHGAEAVGVGAGQSSADALLHDVETVVHHTGGQLTLFEGVHGNSLKQKIRLNIISYSLNVENSTNSKIMDILYMNNP